LTEDRLGDPRGQYGPDQLRSIAFGRQALHAYQLGFEHPADRRPLMFEAPVPSGYTDLLQRLRR
jgi:23S rRNA pseudouridine1911/1915/1917 synthase